MNKPTEFGGSVNGRMEGTTLILTIENGPRNLLNPLVIRQLQRELEHAESNPDVLGVLITGNGDWFCGGLDIPALEGGADPVEFGQALVDCLKVFPTLGVPIAAAVNGDALASGASYISACDYAVAAKTAHIGTMEVSAGRWPMIAQVPVIHRIGARASMENVGSGEPFSAERAKEVGLVQRVVEPGTEVEAALDWLALASRAPSATPEGRRSLYELAQLPYAEALDGSLARFVALFE